MRYAGIINNDVVNGIGVCVSFWSQGCPHRCPGCHNPGTWDFNSGIEGNDQEIIDHIIDLIYKNNVQRNLSILGGEPLCKENIEFTHNLILSVKRIYKNNKIYVWTGYTYQDIVVLCGDKSSILSEDLRQKLSEIMNNIDILVDGKFEKELRDITLPFRGSSNQRIIDVKKSLKNNEVVLYAKDSKIWKSIIWTV